MKNLIHHTAMPLTFDRTRTYEQNLDRLQFSKPRGFWVSDEDDFGWSKWCRGEDWNTEGLAHAQRVTLRDDANILSLTSVEAIRQFEKEYGIVTKWGGPYNDQYTDVGIDWIRAAQEYDGILITPYQWELRLDMLWYNGWDCASGCIWNLSCIEEVESVTMIEEEQCR